MMDITECNTVRLTEWDITIAEPISGQSLAGWITSTQTDTDGTVIYGPFATIKEAQNWAKNLIKGTKIEPVYHPSFNRG